MNRHLQGIVIMLCTLLSAGASGKDRDVCEMRADMVKSIAEQRDKGARKDAIKKTISKAMPQFPDFYIDLIWERRNLSPKEIAAKDFELCLRTP